MMRLHNSAFSLVVLYAKGTIKKDKLDLKLKSNFLAATKKYTLLKQKFLHF